MMSGTRGVVGLVALALVACSSFGPTTPEPNGTAASESPGASSGSSPAASVPESSAALDAFAADIPEDVFTADAEPLNLKATAEAEHASSAVLDFAGGSIEATAADGARYRLDLPEGALIKKTAIVLTPLTNTQGLPGGSSPGVGVRLEPDGLTLFKPGTLTMTPGSAPPDAGVVTLTSWSGGADARVELAKQSPSSVTFSIHHFSDYHVFWPIDEPGWRALARLRIENAALRLASLIAVMLERDRLLQLQSGESKQKLRALAERFLPTFKHDIIEPRIQAATFGCQETIDAIQAVLEYQRQVQQLGVADDPKFTLEVPEELFVLEVDHCMREQFLRCRQYGDFRGFIGYIFEMFERSTDIQARPPDEAVVRLAHSYLEKCGHWRVSVATSEIFGDPSQEEHHYELKREFDIRWQAGAPETSGYYGLLGSETGGMADLQFSKVSVTAKGRAKEVANIQQRFQAYFEIQTISFLLTRTVLANGVANQGEPIPFDVEAYATLGSWSADVLTPKNEPVQIINDSIRVTQALMPEGGSLVIHDGWQFKRNPFKAIWAKAGSGAGASKVRLEIIIEHTPDAAP